MNMNTKNKNTIQNIIISLRNIAEEAQTGKIACADVEEICTESSNLLEEIIRRQND